MANGDAPPAAPDVPHFDTRFLAQTPDGSTTTQVLRTDRPISTDELTAHLAQQGSTFLGYPDTPPPTPPTAAAASPAPAEAAPGEFHPTAAQRARGIFLPERSFGSQVPSIAGATALGSVGGALGALTGPAAPVAIPALSAGGAALGGALGEGGDILYERFTGAAPAEPGTAWERMQNAAIRSGTTELVAGPLAYAVRPVTKAIMPVAKAAADLARVLAQNLPAEVKTVETVTPGVVRSIDRLLEPAGKATVSDMLANPSLKLTDEGQQTLFRAWWQRQAGKAPEEVANAWEGLSGSAQRRLAGPHVESMQTVANTLKTGQDFPGLQSLVGKTGSGGGALGTVGYYTGHPGLAAVGTGLTALRAAQAAGEAAPYVTSRMLQTPSGAGFLANLPRVAQTVAPRLTLPAVGEVPVPLARAGAQSLATFEWPKTATLYGP